MPTTTITRRITGKMSKRLHQARDMAGLSRSQLAAITGLSPRIIAYYEDPTYTRSRKPAFVKSWAEACGVPFEELWGTPGKEISRRACNGGTGSRFLTSQPPSNYKPETTLTSRRRVA